MLDPTDCRLMRRMWRANLAASWLRVKGLLLVCGDEGGCDDGCDGAPLLVPLAPSTRLSTVGTGDIRVGMRLTGDDTMEARN